MCGILAVIGQRTEKEALKSALKNIWHRGPDEQGIWQNEDCTISLGHARLSIIDLEGGKQPLSNADQSLVAVVNGEFYDYQNIRGDLEKAGYNFKTRSDSEILLALYERYGTSALKYLRGEFAFVLWDKKNRLVFAARDYFGIKPLFYTVYDKAIYFASEIKAFKSLNIPIYFDEESFIQTLNSFPQPDSSLFANIYQIEPAHFLIKSLYGEKERLQPYWDFNYPKESDIEPVFNEEQLILGFREILKESVNLRLKADVPVACYLSGGLDSCSLLGIAQKLSKKPVESFTLTFEHADYDEYAQAREMAAFAGSPFHSIHISQDDIASSMEDAVWHAERFMLNGHGVAKFLLSDAVQKAGFKVVLTGEGSDEIFGGYAHFRQDMIANNKKLSEAEKSTLMEELMNTNKVSNGFLFTREDYKEDAINGLLGYMPVWTRSYSKNRPKILDILSPEAFEKFSTRNFATHVFNLLKLAQQVEGREVLARSLYLWSRVFLPYYLLTVLGDRMEMAHSIEARLPFLDHRLVEYVVKMPSQLKIKGMTEKYALREAAKPFITETIYKRQKHPFLAPPAFLAEKDNAMAQLIQDTLRGSYLQKIPFLDRNKIVSILDKYPSFSYDEKNQYEPLIMSLTSACMLQKRFGV